MGKLLEIEEKYLQSGVRIPADVALDRYGSDDASLLGLEQEVRQARRELLQRRAAGITALIDQMVVDSPGQSGAPV